MCATAGSRQPNRKAALDDFDVNAKLCIARSRNTTMAKGNSRRFCLMKRNTVLKGTVTDNNRGENEWGKKASVQRCNAM